MAPGSWPIHYFLFDLKGKKRSDNVEGHGNAWLKRQPLHIRQAILGVKGEQAWRLGRVKWTEQARNISPVFEKKESRLFDLILQLHGNHRKNKLNEKIHDIIKEKISLPKSFQTMDSKGNMVYIPKGTIVEPKRIIAGAFSDNIIRTSDKVAMRNGGSPKEWQKVIGTITSDKFLFDIHWYRNAKTGQSVEFKVKGFPSERKK